MGKTTGKLIVISGPSGVGKGTVISRMLEIDGGQSFWKSVSATTRKPREGEVEGKDYFFMTREDFERTRDAGGFLEWAEYSGNFYATPAASVRERLDEGINVLLEIEVKGAFQVRKALPEAVLIFIEPPSLEELERRLRGRETDDEAAVLRRLETAKVELSHKMEYDKLFVNDDVDETAASLARFIDSID